MISKSAYRSGSNLLFGKKGILGTSLKLGEAIIKDIENMPQETASPLNDNSNNSIQSNGCAIIFCIALAILGIWLMVVDFPFIGFLFLIIPCFVVQDLIKDWQKYKSKAKQENSKSMLNESIKSETNNSLDINSDGNSENDH